MQQISEKERKKAANELIREIGKHTRQPLEPVFSFAVTMRIQLHIVIIVSRALTHNQHQPQRQSKTSSKGIISYIYN